MHFLKTITTRCRSKKDAKVTLMGLRSYAPVYGNSGGSIADKKTVENGNKIYEAFEKRGFRLNPSMLATYEKYWQHADLGRQGVRSYSPEYQEITVTDSVAELSPSELSAIDPNYNKDYKEYSDAAIVVVGRPGGESKNYYIGSEGLSDGTTTDTGNIMGLSSEEKAVIEEAKKNFDKVIVLVNSVTTMEIGALQNDPDIDAVMWIGYPGPYGFYAVADVLNGTVSPSAHLGDTVWRETISQIPRCRVSEIFPGLTLPNLKPRKTSILIS